LLVAIAAGSAVATEDPEDEPAPADRGAEPALPALRHETHAGPPGTFLGREIPRGTKQRFGLVSRGDFTTATQDILVLVTRGKQAGPTLCVTAAVHGDEINGVEIARAVFERSNAATLRGMLVALPIVNSHGFRRGDRFLADRRDLNRFFPGSPRGSNAQRLAHEVFSRVIIHCDALVDLHTGSLDRSNLPQIRADLSNPRVAALAERFDVGIVLEGAGPEGALRRSAVEAGVPAILYEAGQPSRFERDEIARGIEGVENVLEHLGMLEREPPTPNPQRIYRRTRWLRAETGGIFLTDRALGDVVQRGDVLGSVTDPLTDARAEIVAPMAGRILGMALPQVVLPGFATFHLGLAPEQD
jgi:hypothetical protein